MNEIPLYVTQLSRKDMADIRDATNPQPAPGIEIRREKNGWVIGINQNQLKRWMRAFYENGGMRVPIGDIDSVSLDFD